MIAATFLAWTYLSVLQLDDTQHADLDLWPDIVVGHDSAIGALAVLSLIRKGVVLMYR